MKYTQNNENEFIDGFFKDEIITCMSLGENSGIHLSNVRALLERGCKGILVEPAPKAFASLCELYADRPDVECYNFAVSNKCGKFIFHDSGTHLHQGDLSLLSSLHKSEIKKWEPTTEFMDIEVNVVDFETLLKLSPYKTFDFISIDCEGEDWNLLAQMDLIALGVRLLCIEHNSVPEVKQAIIEYCASHGLVNILLDNAENIIISK